MRQQLQRLLENRLNQCVSSLRNPDNPCEKLEAKREIASRRAAEIVKVKGNGKIVDKYQSDDVGKVTYQVHLQYLIRQKDQLYVEEEMELRKAEFFKGTLVKDEEVNQLPSHHHYEEFPTPFVPIEDDLRVSYQYDRLKAIQYAETWWNDYNPAYKKFEENDCTNYISQCLSAGGAPMRGYPNRGSGWWYRGGNYSWSWSTAHALYLHLSNSKVGLRAQEVSRPDQLMLGDIICYDFEGDGRFNHNTIVTAWDYYGMPLVNAHSYNSRHRYWAYEDSSAYTPNIQYKFFRIIDDE
jgi:hypothetical protein